MANVWMDTGFPDSPHALNLCETLQERHAWCHALRLWSWGIDQNREDGVLHLDPQRIAEVASYRGNPEVFVDALVKADLLRKLGKNEYYMCGWSRTAEYFKKKNRMREYRAKKREECVPPRDTPRVPRYDDVHDDDDICKRKDLLISKKSIDESVGKVAAHFCEKHPTIRRQAAKKSNLAKIKTRLTEKLGDEPPYTPDQLIEAINGNALDPWHVERRKHDLEYVLRDCEHVDKFIAIARHGPERPRSTAPIGKHERAMLADMAFTKEYNARIRAEHTARSTGLVFDAGDGLGHSLPEFGAKARDDDDMVESSLHD